MRTYLLTWNPSRWTWKTFADDAARVARGEEVELPWSVGGTKQIRSGDRLFMLRQGEEPRGIVASGFASCDWYEDQHFDPKRSRETTTYVKVAIDRLDDVKRQGSPFLSTRRLGELLPGLITRVQRSGTEVPEDIAVGLEQLWKAPERLEMARTDAFPDGITKEDVRAAIQWIDDNRYPPTFGRATDYGLVAEDKRLFPPKVVAGLAARRARGRMMFSQEFRGGEDTPCFKLLRSLGFEVRQKRTASKPGRLQMVVGRGYSPKQVQVARDPGPTGEEWRVGHYRLGVDTYIFAELGGEEHIGSGYGSYWSGDHLHWWTRKDVGHEDPRFKAMLEPADGGQVFIFTGEQGETFFTYEGVGRVVSSEGDRPIKIIWRATGAAGREIGVIPEEVEPDVEFSEGALRQISVNAYERDPRARRACINHYGCRCQACGFDFEEVYGEIGEGFIHVHHCKPLSQCAGSYAVNPINDLRPVCPNCHAMLHRYCPPMEVEELRRILGATGAAGST